MPCVCGNRNPYHNAFHCSPPPRYTDDDLTTRFRHYLRKNNVVCPDFYTWADGEALYYGDPLEPKATPQEMQAIAQVYQLLER